MLHFPKYFLQTFVGSKSRNEIATNWFQSSVVMRYVRIKPVSSEERICLRVNFYGCPLGKNFVDKNCVDKNCAEVQSVASYIRRMFYLR